MSKLAANLPHTVGLTGGIGSGKSQARKMFEQAGVPCIDADMVAREIHQQPDHPALIELAQAFPSAMTSDGLLSRGSMRSIFSTDPIANARLKSILGPHVMKELRAWSCLQSCSFVVWESALIIDEKISVDRILVVDASYETQVERVLLRNPDWSREQIDGIIKLQLPRELRVLAADDVIDNNGTVDKLREQVTLLCGQYLKLWKD